MPLNINRPNDLERIYRRTLRYELCYYIPDSVTDDKEVYNVDFAFWDAVPQIPAFDGAVNSNLSDVLAPAKVDALTQALVDEDGVHPIAAGFAIMAPLAEAGIEQALKRSHN